MKKSGILNRHLAGGLAHLGHTDLAVVCDAGLPIPEGPLVVDLAFRAGVPRFAEVLHGILDEIVVEAASAASEVRERNPETTALLDGLFPELETIPHEEFKARTQGARLVVRTGEVTPYSNVLLQCGVFY